MIAALTGRAAGSNRAELLTHAQEAAVQYFGQKCVTVTLSNEECDSEVIHSGGQVAIRQSVKFTANWTARVDHNWESPAYGFPKCRGCGKLADSL